MLDVPISFFFDDMPEPLAGLQGTYQTTRAAGGIAENQDGFGADEMLNRRETLSGPRLLPNNEPSVRKRVFDLIKSMGPVEA